MAYLKRRLRGMTLVESMIALAVAAAVVFAAFTAYNTIITGIKGTSYATILQSVESDLARFSNVWRNCGGAAPTDALDPVGELIVLGAAVTSAPNATATSAEERCENAIWGAFNSALRRPVDAAGATGLAGVDTDDVTEWVVGSDVLAPEVGWRIWPTAIGDWNGITGGVTVLGTGNAAAAGNVPCTPDPDANEGPAAIMVFAAEDLSVCEAARSKFTHNPTGIYATICQDIGGTAPAGLDDDNALLLACVLDTSI